MKKNELRDKLQKLLAKKFQNIDENFVFPDLKVNTQNDFPYVTVVFKDFRLDTDSNRYVQDVSIIGIDRGEDDELMYKKDMLQEGIFQALHKNGEVNIVITGGSDSNLFKPFGLEMGLFPPYCGCRVDAIIPNSLTLG